MAGSYAVEPLRKHRYSAEVFVDGVVGANVIDGGTVLMRHIGTRGTR